MANGKFSNGKRTNLKPVALLLAIALLVGTAVGGTLAWLTDKTDTVKNTFTVGNIDIDLTETKEPYKMIPGHTLHKDPKVTVMAGSEDCWIFVKVEESDNLTNYITYEVDPNNWKQLDGVEGVYYTYAKDITANRDIKVLLNEQVLVRDTVTKDMMDSFDADRDGVLSDAEKATLPTLTFTAYAVQYYKTNGTPFEAAEAWATANSAANS